MNINTTVAASCALLLAACATPPVQPDNASLQKQVADTERAFAASMAHRDLNAFSGFLSEDALFFSGKILRGKQNVIAGWKPLFEKPDAPFSWAPDEVDVVDSGTLAMSTGLVRDPKGKVVGRFRSIWRQEAPGQWRIVFDKGDPSCSTAQ